MAALELDSGCLFFWQAIEASQTLQNNQCATYLQISAAQPVRSFGMETASLDSYVASCSPTLEAQ